MSSISIENCILDPESPGGKLILSDPSFIEYARLRAVCCVAQSDEFGLSQMISTAGNAAQSKAFAQVKASAAAGNADDVLELGMRLYAGFQTPKNNEDAHACFLRLAEQRTPNYIPHASRSIRARAHALVANAHYDNALAMRDNMDPLYLAGKSADRCVALGFIPAVIFEIANAIENSGLRKAEDGRVHLYRIKRFLKLENLWRVIEERIAEARRFDAKIEKRPNAYHCAADGCPIKATQKAGLLRCAGPCSHNIKPSYCSKQCQVKDWKRHKPFCKGKGQASQALGGPSTTITRTSDKWTSGDPDVEDIDAWGTNGNGKVISIDIDLPTPRSRHFSQTTQTVSSKTVGPEALKWLREKALREARLKA